MGTLLSSEDSIAGYHVLQVQENSPAENAGLEVFFDFITAICHIQLVGSDEVFLALLSSNLDRPTLLTVYSRRTKQSREVCITPRTDWGGRGALGLTIRYCSVKEALQNVRRILKVFPGSPAEYAGLKDFTDYIIATERSLLPNDESFANFTRKFNQRPLRLFVYNVENASCRVVEIIPNINWGGDGALGCAVGSGLLHQIPADALQTPFVIARFVINSIIEAVTGVEPFENEEMCSEINEDKVANSTECKLASEAGFVEHPNKSSKSEETKV